MTTLIYEGHLPKKVRFRERDEDPPPNPKPTYSVALGNSTMDVEPVTCPWPIEEFIEPEEGDTTHLTGEAGAGVMLSQTFKAKLDKQWEKSVVIKLLGHRIGYRVLCSWLANLWSLKGPMKVIDLDYDYFLVKFLDNSDFINALTNRPWVPRTFYCSISPNDTHSFGESNLTVPLRNTVELDGETASDTRPSDSSTMQRGPEGTGTGVQTAAGSNGYGPWMMVQWRTPPAPVQRQNHRDINKHKTVSKVGGVLTDIETMDNDPVAEREPTAQRDLTGVGNSFNLADLVGMGHKKGRDGASTSYISK
ncbi:hypothetical protein K2173_013797 [Erythroxylum novogranatense]|uniref:DUF4283 domain-containing protein n=1 Tax=Erythroxylum novogranatense TaxID=1862640 RepID=A0AAV8SCK9_9ROSI|nr:hypothetical protein K2173_013797 [Erythroxylum novogranatense]